MKKVLQAVISLLNRVVVFPGVIAYALIMGIYVVFFFDNISRRAEQRMFKGGWSLPFDEDILEEQRDKIVASDLSVVPVVGIVYIFWIILIIALLVHFFPNLYR